MIALDTNILVYARRVESPWHTEAMRLIGRLAEGREPWALPWPCVYEYLRVVTHPRLFRPASDLRKTLDELDALAESPSLTFLGETVGHRARLRRALESGHAVGNLVHDGHIAALLLEHGVREFWTTDKDFNRFPGIAVRNPFLGDEIHETRVRYVPRTSRTRRPLRA